ncbi:hypothetical protein [Flavobacterium sp.]|uniref:hypothetical protein n=1 Tax=Flavobacterium sp. TaxID=239 RepID=UPI00262F0660|nr:hypothetical protein [Flavobacterium sp.]
MRNIILLLFFFTVTSCHKRIETEIAQNIEVEKPEMTDKEFMEKLIKADFFKYAESTVDIQQIDSLNAYDENTNKFARIDAEELAEFSIDYFVPQLTKMLAKRNIEFTVKKTDNTEKLNEININGENIILYTKEELENGNFWNSAIVNFFNKLNRIMEENKSNERFYLVNEGNDLSTFLLTNSQLELFQSRYENEMKEIPRRP